MLATYRRRATAISLVLAVVYLSGCYGFGLTLPVAALINIPLISLTGDSTFFDRGLWSMGTMVFGLGILLLLSQVLAWLMKPSAALLARGKASAARESNPN